MKGYPKLLIINDESIYKKNATGITLRSLVRTWPTDSIIEFHLWNPSEEEREDLEFKSFLLPANVLPINRLFRLVTRASQENESNGISFGRNISTLSKWNLTHDIKEYAKYIGESKCVNIRPVVELLSRESFIPDVIYTMGSRFAIHSIVDKLANYYKCGTCFHFMDNWRESAFVNTSSILKLNYKLNLSINKVMEHNTNSLVISPLMKIAYEDKYKGNYDVLMNSVSINKPCKFVNHDSIHFVYAGGLHLNRYVSLLVIQDTISRVRINAKLYIYTSITNRKKYENLFDKNITVFRDFLPHNRVREVYEDADVLLHVESFDEKQLLYIKYSLSTKIPEYMSSGKPILCYAPENISVYQYVNITKSGLCASNKASLEKCILALYNSAGLRKKIGCKGYNQALIHHEIHMSQNRFVSVIKSNVKQ